MEQEEIDAKQAEIGTCLKLYKDQITLDYDAFKLQKERVIMLSHLAQRQSADNLDLNLRMVQIAQFNEVQITKEVEDKILRKTVDLEHSISITLIQHRDLVRIHLQQLTDKISPYDVTDMQRFISFQNNALNDMHVQNAIRSFACFSPLCQ